MRAMILAAGRGERLRPLTDTLPKPLITAGGRALIDYHLDALARAGIERIVINTAWLGAQLRDYVGPRTAQGIPVDYSDEPWPALETGGGIRAALDLLGDAPFWLVNGDVWCDYDFGGRPLADGDLAHLVMVDNPPHNPGGDFALAHGRIAADGPARLTYAGIAMLHPRLVAGHAPGRFPLAPLLSDAADAGLVSGEHFGGRWFDVGTPRRLRELDSALAG